MADHERSGADHRSEPLGCEIDATRIAGVLGGTGLFLLGMRLMTEGLRVAAGPALRRILARWTGTRLRGVLSGVLITSLVQSSSAVTVAAIGFVNAGLLTLAQAVAVIYGANVGTTTTAWLVAAVGFHVDVKAFALPAVGVGMALRLVGGGRRIAPLGEAVAGFGIFFLGIDVLRTAFAGLGADSLVAVAGTGPLTLLLQVGLGAALTLLMQSSSAALALILTAAGGGVVAIEGAAAMVIGANIGTTSTAAIAVIGATANARRVAAAHMAFNGFTGVVALLLLPGLLLALTVFRRALDLDAEPAAVLAGFHTLFNVLGVLLLWPFTDGGVRWLERRFRTSEEDEATPRYLDRNVAATPVLALHALALELARTGALARRMAAEALAGRPDGVRLAATRASVGRLVEAVGGFTAGLQGTRLPAEFAEAPATALRVGRYWSEVAELAEMVAAASARLEPLPGDLAAAVRAFEAELRGLLDAAAVETPGTSSEACAAALEALEQRYHALKAELLRAGAAGRVPVGALVELLDRLSNLRRLAQQAERAALHLRALGALATGTEGDAEGAGPAAPSLGGDPRG